MSTVFIILLVILLIIVGIILFINIGVRFALFTASTFIDIIKSPASLFLIMCFIVVAILALIINQKSARDSSYAPSNDIPVTTEYKRSLPENKRTHFNTSETNTQTRKMQEEPYQKTNEGEYKPNQSAQENHNYIMDSRDGKTYKTVKLGNQVWMAENLNYETNGSYCYKDDPEKCAKYGRLYIWESALNACPVGWHLPTKEEYETLLNYVEKQEEETIEKLYSDSEEKYERDLRWGGYFLARDKDRYGFSVLPVDCDYWTATENDGNRAYNMFLDDMGFSSFWDSQKDHKSYVHCLRNP